MCKIFKENKLSVTVACNLAINNFLDVTFYLKSVTNLQNTEQRDILYT